MKRTLMQPDLSSFPEQFRPLLASAKVYDSSCSPIAKVWFLDTEGGLYLKSAPLGKLESEVKMTAYFHSKGLGAEVIAYHQDTRDWLLTRAIPGEASLVEKLPSLRVGECLLVGDAVTIPSVVRVDTCDLKPASNDIPYFDLWQQPWKDLDFIAIKEEWFRK